MEEQKITSFFRFEDLRIYNKSMEYYSWLTEVVKHSDDLARRVLLVPMLDSAAKISLNIAEGTSYHKSQFINYLKMAKSNVRECVVFTTMALQNGYMTAEQSEFSRNTLIEMTKMLGAMVVSLQKHTSKREESNHPQEISTQSAETVQEDGNTDFNLEFNY